MSAATGEENQSSSSFPWEQQLCRRFSLAEIESVTQNFDEGLVIGRGGFGKVYKGSINNGSGTIAAIKRLDSGSTQGASEFWAEVEMLSKLRHCHLVSLIGYCNDGDEMILVYEHMPHGTLEDHLHKGGTILSWVQRLQICIGAARGLHYLHTGTGTQHGVIHRDVKSSNILLDENWAAKISDFGLSKMGPTNQPSTYVNTVVKGTFGYLDPEYFLTGRLTRKSDVYAFGVVLFEVLCGRRAIDRSLNEEQWGLARWAQECIEEGKLIQIIDSHVRRQISPKCLKEFAHIATRCVHGRPKLRPTMAEVGVSLELAMKLQERADNPTQPAGISAFTRKVQRFFFAPVAVNSDVAKPSKDSENENDSVLPNEGMQATAKAITDGAKTTRTTEHAVRTVPAPEANSILQAAPEQRQGDETRRKGIVFGDWGKEDDETRRKGIVFCDWDTEDDETRREGMTFDDPDIEDERKFNEAVRISALTKQLWST